MSRVPVADHAPLRDVAVEMLASLYQHRLLTTEQLHALHTPQAVLRSTRRILAPLLQRGLIDRVQSLGTFSLWYLTEAGARTIEATGVLAEPRRWLGTPAQAAGPLRRHTIAVNDVGIAFVEAARAQSDECGPCSWRHEIAHPISPRRGHQPAELLVADALLSYVQIAEDGAFTLHQRFIELDRGTARPAEQLANKITRYARLRHYTPPGASATDASAKPLWRRCYRSFPHLLVVLADQTPERTRQRIHRTIALHQSDPTSDQHGAVPVSFVALGDLTERGPFAAIFIDAEHPEKPVDWLGEPQQER
jgi:hypothetical protein